MHDKVVLGIIPARGGSKGVPRKNITPLAGRPLLAHTCAAALASARLSRVVLSTDDPEIAAVGRECGVDVPFLRPAKLAADDTPSLDVLVHTLDWLAERERFHPGVLVLLQPTSPLRRAEQIDRAVDLLLDTGADSVVSVVEVPHQFNPHSVLRVDDGRLVPFLDGPTSYRRQDKPRVYARNGPAILAVRSEVVRRGELYGADTRPLVMDAFTSADIDDASDLLWAEFLLERGQ